MKKHEVDPNRGIFLIRTAEGWIVTKLTHFNIMTNDEEEQFLGYDIGNSLFNQAFIPEKVVTNLLSYITEDSSKQITELDLFN